MIAYTCVGTNDWDKATNFYDSLMAEAGAKPVVDMGRFRAYGTAPDAPMFAVVKPFDEAPATVGNGTMIALACGTEAQVNKMHDKAVALGGTCDGPCGPRAGGAFYLGYVRDLDGNKLAFFAPPNS